MVCFLGTRLHSCASLFLKIRNPKSQSTNLAGSLDGAPIVTQSRRHKPCSRSKYLTALIHSWHSMLLYYSQTVSTIATATCDLRAVALLRCAVALLLFEAITPGPQLCFPASPLPRPRGRFSCSPWPTFSSLAIGRCLSSDVPVQEAAAPAPFSVPYAPVRGVWSPLVLRCSSPGVGGPCCLFCPGSSSPGRRDSFLRLLWSFQFGLSFLFCPG